MASPSKAERRAPARLWPCALALACVLALVALPVAQANPSGAGGARLDDAVRYLQEAQNADGGFPAAVGGTPSAGFTAWAALALAAAGINPQEQARPAGASAYGFLAEHAVELSATTDFERELLVTEAAGTSPHDFGSRDLVTTILSRQLTSGPEAGAFVHQDGETAPGVNDTIFAILSLGPRSEPAVRTAVDAAVSWLTREQDPGGSWPSVCPRSVCPGEPEHNVEMTAAAIQALRAVGLRESPAQSKALAFLHEAELSNGGFPEAFPAPPGDPEAGAANVASTAWVVSAIFSSDENPESWRRAGSEREPLGYMESMQHEDGHLQWKASSDENPVFMTAYAGIAFAGDWLPVPTPESKPPPSTPPTGGASSGGSPVGENGQGGEGAATSRGVLVGGGGAGAAPFSRPRAHSRGHTAGGVGRSQPEERTSAKARRRDPGPRRASAPSTGHSSSRSLHHRGHSSAKSPAVHGAGTQVALSGSAGAGTAGQRGDTVKGVLLGTSLAAYRGALEPGAPGLRAAGAGEREGASLAGAIAFLAALLALLGARLERRRPDARP